MIFRQCNIRRVAQLILWDFINWISEAVIRTGRVCYSLLRWLLFASTYSYLHFTARAMAPKALGWTYRTNVKSCGWVARKHYSDDDDDLESSLSAAARSVQLKLSMWYVSTELICPLYCLRVY
jgi:hypothetical protein